MRYSDNEMCTILLSSYIGIREDSGIKPLSLGEWHKFVDILVENKLEPSIVYTDEVMKLMDYGYDAAFVDRIRTLVGRGASVAFELEEYEKKGIHVITFIDKQYPVLFRRVLKNKKPPVLFYSGDISLVNKMGIGVVGSRNITDAGMQFTVSLVEKAVNENLVIYSGGAKGVDETAQTVALNHGGAVVAYIADSLAAKIKKRDVAKYIAEGKLLLISDLKPDVGFSAGRAMNRNKFIYAAAMGTFVVESDYNKGGTWNGAMEAIKNKWGKVFVWNKTATGNEKIIEAGGCAYDITDMSLVDVVSNQQVENENEKYTQLNLIDLLG